MQYRITVDEIIIRPSDPPRPPPPKKTKKLIGSTRFTQVTQTAVKKAAAAEKRAVCIPARESEMFIMVHMCVVHIIHFLF